MRLLALAVGAAAFGTPSFAQMPHYDVTTYCKQVAGFGGSYSETLNASCFEMEQSAYDQLKPDWDSLQTSMKEYCNQVATFGGSGSYSLLQSCIQMEQQAGSASKNFKY